MAKTRYKRGKILHNISEFEYSKTDMFYVSFGNVAQLKHRAFLISWQYRTLKMFIDRWRIAEAIKEEGDNSDESKT